MKTYTKKMEPKEVVASTRCDWCDAEATGEPQDWASGDWWHNDWGNASVNSGDDFDACCANCLLALIDQIVKGYDPGPEPTLEISIDAFGLSFAKELAAVGVSKETLDAKDN